MSSQRLSPAMRNLLRAVITHGRAPQCNPAKTAPTLQALRQRGLLDASNQPSQAGRAVFTHPTANTKHLNTTKEVTC